MEDRISVLLTPKKLNQQKCYDFVQDASCGGIVTFTGTVRNHTSGKEVKQLEFSAYTSMAVKELIKIAERALKRFDILKIALHHAEGLLQVGDIPVIIAVSSSHRKAAFEACEYAINTLKETVPIWKKEFFEDGEVWVNAHP
ncbi:MAG: molybdenum cofactor biosynthesis protein MoaE [Flavobacteriia bacterium]|nr:MAG: molybdenum cofactor biosynthesis protein MoaE [Flavobacteriia bacterium]